MANNTTSVLTLVQDSTSDNKPLILGAVGVGLGGLALIFLAFQSFAPVRLTASPLFQRIAGLMSCLTTNVQADVKKDLVQTVEKVMSDPSSAIKTITEGITTSLSDISVDVLNAANIKVDAAHLGDIQAMLQLMGKPHVVTSAPTGATGAADSSPPGTMYSTI